MKKVTLLKLSKRMKELGWDYETERYWVIPLYKDGTPYLATEGLARSIKADIKLKRTKNLGYKIAYPAPDAIEIGERLPQNHQIIIVKEDKYGCVWETKDEIYEEQGKTMAECLGKMWCYLKEKGLIQ